MKNLLLGLFLFLCLSGCKEVGLNVKMGSADAGAGVAVIATLEAVPVEKFEATKAKIIEISTSLLGFVETGSLAQLPLSQVEVKLDSFLISKGYGDYTYLVDACLQYIKTQRVNVQEIGTNNVLLIKIALTETIRNARRCTIEGRTK